MCVSYLAQRTQLMCWLREKRNFCLCVVHTLIVLSSEAVTRVCPSPEKLTLRTVAVWALNTVDSAFLYGHKTLLKFKTNKQNPEGVQQCVSSSMLAEGDKQYSVVAALYESPSLSSVVNLWWNKEQKRQKDFTLTPTCLAPKDVQSCLWRQRPPDGLMGKSGWKGRRLCVHQNDTLASEVSCSRSSHRNPWSLWLGEDEAQVWVRTSCISKKEKTKATANSYIWRQTDHYQFVSCCSWSPHLLRCPCDPWNVFLGLDQTMGANRESCQNVKMSSWLQKLQ